MSAERDRRAEAIFYEAAELPKAERAAFLDRACAGDESLRLEVEALLRHDSAVGDAFLSGGAALEGPRAGDLIGRYRLIEVVGEGGFGVVHRAEQVEPVRREVAVKVIKLGMDTRQVVARFQAERQSLALMDHPNIARVLDAGATGEGRPFFVMEFVRGAPITTYCDERRLTTRRRLDLFQQVCAAVQHAHQKGLIHRDLKPGNVLVEDVDGAPLAKVIDFGIARAVDTTGSGGTLITERGQLIGTPEYMSPEQAAGAGAAIDTRTDIYSLGVLLYELLTGTLPFDPAALRAGGLAEAQRMIREVEPRRPSTRPSAPGPKTAEMALLRGVDPPTLSRALRGDLDWIVLRAMEKDPARRYESASELAADIRRHLANEPVLAGPPGRAYRFSKFIRRHRVGAVATAIVALALIVGVVGTTTGLVRAVRAERLTRAAAVAEADQRAAAERARDAARAEAAQSAAVTRFLQDMLASVRPAQARGATVTVEDVLEQASLRVGSDTADTPKIEAALRTVIGDSYRAIGRYDDAERHTTVGLAIAREKLGPETLEAAEALYAHGMLLQDRNRYAESERDHRDALRIRRTLLPERSPEVAASLGAIATCLRLAERYDEAEALSRESLALRREIYGDKHVQVATAMDSLAQTLNRMGRFDDAEAIFRESLAMRRELLPENHPDLGQSLNNLASVLHDRTRYEEAEPLYRESIALRRKVHGEMHQAVAQPLNNLATLLQDKGDFAGAEALFQESLTIRRKALGDDNPSVARAMNNLAVLKYIRKDFEGAADLFRQVIAIYERTVDAKNPILAQAKGNLGGALNELGRPDEAVIVLSSSADELTKSVGPDNPLTLSVRYNLSRTLHRAGRIAEAETVGRDALERRERVLGHDHPDTLNCLRGLALILADRAQFEDSERLCFECERRLEARPSATDRERKLLATTIQMVYEKWGRADDAARWKQKSDSFELAK